MTFDSLDGAFDYDFRGGAHENLAVRPSSTRNRSSDTPGMTMIIATASVGTVAVAATVLGVLVKMRKVTLSRRNRRPAYSYEQERDQNDAGGGELNY